MPPDPHPSVTAPERSRATRRPWLALFLGMIVAGLGFVLPRLSHYHGDECFYTDAALRMVQTGDYWTPRYADGRLRLIKPIATYWVIAASYRTLGIGYFSTRLPFLLMGCAVVWLTGRLAHTLFHDPAVALLAALVAGSNFQLLALQIRSTPDILLCGFVLLSMLGFARLLFARDRSLASYLMAYVGAGLAVQTKGLLGLCPLGFVLVFWLANRRQAGSLRELWDWRAVLVGFVVAAFWYLVMFAQHGSQSLHQFLDDQVTAKVAFSPRFWLANLGHLLLAPVRHFLPWTALVLLAIAVDFGAFRAAIRRFARPCAFLLGWALCLTLLFSFSQMRRSRYLVAAYPMLAALFGYLLVQFTQLGRTGQWLPWVLRATAAGLLAVGAALAWLGTRAGAGLIAGGGLLAILAVLFLVVARRRTPQTQINAFALAPLVVFIVVENCVRPVFSFSPAPALTRVLLDAAPPPDIVHAWRPESSYPSQMRVLSGGRLRMETPSDPATALAARQVSPVILSDLQTNEWASTGYRLTRVAAGGREWTAAELKSLVWGPAPGMELARHQKAYFLGEPGR